MLKAIDTSKKEDLGGPRLGKQTKSISKTFLKSIYSDQVLIFHKGFYNSRQLSQEFIMLQEYR
jgi:hypothetical protein